MAKFLHLYHLEGTKLIKYRALLPFILALLAPVSVLCQGDSPRDTVAITYPLDQTITVKFRGTTRLPRVIGEAKVSRAGRRGTRVELNIDNLPRASELGSIYTTYVLWAISPEGRVDNLGEIKRSGSVIVDSKIDVTTPLQTFALIVTAEPHFLMRWPSRMVVLENLPPQRIGDVEIKTVNVQYLGNSSDYLKDITVPDLADKEFKSTPVSLLGARQALSLARYAKAEEYATSELEEALSQLQQAENAWRMKKSESDVDALARRATSLGSRAEEIAEARRAARERREEISRRDELIRNAERAATETTRQVEDLRSELDKEKRDRQIIEKDLMTANQQLSDLKVEVARLRADLERERKEGSEAKVNLARIEGERQAQEAIRAAERRRVELESQLRSFGTSRKTERGYVLTLPETIWTNSRSAELSPNSGSTLDSLAALLANNPDLRIVIESHTDNRGDAQALKTLTQQRADALAERFKTAGVAGTRVQATGMGSANPLTTRPAGRVRNRRTEIIFIPDTQVGNIRAEGTAGP
jgi:outer membrane protein OmpA-like peptidoglycan-associated protein